MYRRVLKRFAFRTRSFSTSAVARCVMYRRAAPKGNTRPLFRSEYTTQYIIKLKFNYILKIQKCSIHCYIMHTKGAVEVDLALYIYIFITLSQYALVPSFI